MNIITTIVLILLVTTLLIYNTIILIKICKKTKYNKEEKVINNNMISKTYKELKIKKILFYIFASLTSILLLTEVILMASIILSIIAYTIIIPTIGCGIVTIILHNDIKQLKFQLYLNEIINHRDSN